MVGIGYSDGTFLWVWGIFFLTGVGVCGLVFVLTLWWGLRRQTDEYRRIGSWRLWGLR